VVQLKRVSIVVALTLFMLLICATTWAGAEDKPVKLGMRGDDVAIVQKLLAEKGFYSGEIDGFFGKGTQNAVKEFQSTNGLSADGVVGKETFHYLERSSGTEPARYSRVLTMSASAYSAYDTGNSSRTCTGNVVRKGLVAVDPAVIPLGTRIFIAGYGTAIADDVGGSIRGNRIDLAFDSHGEAIQFGRQNVTVYILD
jgi:3D (Asp-Asp-Asp) domain-containing protein